MSKQPGQILLRNFMQPLGINANQLATGLGVNRSSVGRLISGEQRMTLEMAARLGAYFGIPARWWLMMQVDYDARVIENRPELREAVVPMRPDPDVLLMPTGVLQLHEPGGEAEHPPSLPRAVLEAMPRGATTEGRRVNTVEYESGSVAPVGDDS